jgi:hypothetical protein
MLNSLLVLLSTLFISPSDADTTKSEAWKTLELKKYSIQYPQTWSIDTTENSGMEFMISSPFTDEEDIYYDFVNLAVMPMYGLGKNLDTYVADVVKDIPFFYSKAVIAKNAKEKKSGKDCYVLTYAGILNTFPIAMHQYIWFENDMSYTLTFTAEQGAFEKWFKDAEHVMDSFKFKK